jgi:hypothetical protein
MLYATTNEVARVGLDTQPPFDYEILQLRAHCY